MQRKKYREKRQRVNKIVDVKESKQARLRDYTQNFLFANGFRNREIQCVLSG